MKEGKLIEAIIWNNPDATALNLKRLGIANVNPDPSSIANIISNIKPKAGTELDILSRILDVPIIPGNPGYDVILENISTKSIVKGNLQGYFSKNEFQKKWNWEYLQNDRVLMTKLITYGIIIFFMLLTAYIIFSLISKIFQDHDQEK